MSTMKQRVDRLLATEGKLSKSNNGQLSGGVLSLKICENIHDEEADINFNRCEVNHC